MSYSTPAQVRALLLEDGASAPSGGASDLSTPASFSDAELQPSIDEADALIDGTLRDIYTVPFDPVPQLIEAVSAGVAQFLATLTFRKSTDVIPADPSRLRYNYARDLLDRIANGTLVLDAEPASTDGPSDPINTHDQDLWTIYQFNTCEPPWPKSWA